MVTTCKQSVASKKTFFNDGVMQNTHTHTKTQKNSKESGTYHTLREKEWGRYNCAGEVERGIGMRREKGSSSVVFEREGSGDVIVYKWIHMC